VTTASWYFTDWSSLWHVAATAACAWGGLVLLLRAGGKRTLAQFTVFDWAVTVAFGSILATTIVSSSVSLADGLVALAMLVGLQTAAAFLSTRFHGVERALTGEPALVALDGRLLRDTMNRLRVSEDQVLQAVRGSGHAALDEVAAVVLETTGALSVLEQRRADARALDGVSR
jgi:uncharacterized membrane protein YcaP (DUF421 family)